MPNVKDMKKKPMFVAAAAVVILLLIIGGIFIVSKVMKKPAPATTKTQKKKITDPVNIIDQAERPFIEIKPLDEHNIAVAVNQVKKEATSMDFELEYQTDTSLEGLTGNLDLASLPSATKPILLGTCSAGGACRYHTGVQGGNILTKFSGGAATYALKQDWKYIDNAKKGTEFSSQDAFFQITSKDLASERFLVIFNTPGYPGTPKGTVISEAYALSATSSLSGKATLSMRAKDDAAGAVIMGWDGQNWKEFAGKVDGKSVTAEVDLLPVYVVVKK